MANTRVPLEPATFFHIYNHAVGDDNLFREESNYDFFLAKIEKWIVPFCGIHAYCLMPNHFHLLLRINEERLLKNLWQDKLITKMSKAAPELMCCAYPKDFKDEAEFRIQYAALVDKIINEQFSHCFNSYVQSFNRRYNRTGSLMRESFKRNKIDSDDYLRTATCYIHNNPVLHGFVNSPSDWLHSSYNTIITESPSFVVHNEVLEFFDGMENFLFVHNEHLMANS